MYLIFRALPNVLSYPTFKQETVVLQGAHGYVQRLVSPPMFGVQRLEYFRFLAK